MLMSTDVASIMLPVSRALLDRDRELETMAGVHPNPGGAPAAVRGMKRGDPEPDGQTAAALVDSTGAECKRPRIDGSGGIGEVGQVRRGVFVQIQQSRRESTQAWWSYKCIPALLQSFHVCVLVTFVYLSK